tara:strand:+ start:113 stop:799 length:687 start_codon:yes stop_codon:yes gene_type:complete
LLNNKSVLAIIPARKSSKRLPNKNKLLLAGKPLVAWTIQEAKKSKYIDSLIISSDDHDIHEIASKYGVKSLHRPDHLATDRANTAQVCCEIINKLDKSFHYIILLQPTSPLRKSIHIDAAFDLLIKKSAEAVISVCEAEHTPIWMNTLPSDLSLEKFLPNKFKNMQSQEFEKYFRLNGAIYICETKKLVQEKTFFLSKNIYAFKMDQRYSVDIDSIIDFKLAESLVSK